MYRYLSHAQHIGDRFLVGYPRDGAWHKPDMKVVSLYVDQKPDGDQSAARAKEFGFPGVSRRLPRRCGAAAAKLAVDAVLVIGEHGDYPRNDKGQVLYPRYDFVKQCVDVFEKDGRGGAGLQRQAPVVQLRQGQVDGRRLEAAEVSDARGIVTARDLAAARTSSCRRTPRSRAR